jgi:putative transposase
MPLYHVWFSTKRRKWLLQDDVLDAMRQLLHDVAAEKGINLVESEAIVDHVHLLVDVSDASELPRTMMLLKGISARRLFGQFPDIKLDAHTESFWQASYGSKLVVPEAASATKSYIRSQWDRLESYDRQQMPRGLDQGTARYREG